MSLIIERFWKPQPKDVPGGLIAQERYYLSSGAVALANALVSFTSPVMPSNTLTVLTHWSANLTGGAAQISQRAVLQIVDPSGTAQFQLAQEPNYVLAAATQWSSTVVLGEGIVLRPNERITLLGQFNAGVAANTLLAFVFGYRIPVGNTL